MEETLYDISGNPIAYIAYGNEAVIYMWQGKPVAYLYRDCIYGFNGKHLGWYDNGIIRNTDGLIIGFNKKASDVFVKFEPFKGFKEFLPFKSFREFAHIKPFFSRSKSRESLLQFLLSGVE